MRIKKACQVTGLTERAIRLYVKKGLLALLAGLWLNIPRLQGFLPIGPLTVTAVTEELVTVALEDEEITALLGRMTLTVPYAIHSRSLTPEERIPHGVQLVLLLTNLDLLRMGISPLADFSTAYPALNDAWLQTVFQAMREEDWRRCGQLVFFDYPNVGPLQWWKG